MPLPKPVKVCVALAAVADCGLNVFFALFFVKDLPDCLLKTLAVYFLVQTLFFLVKK